MLRAYFEALAPCFTPYLWERTVKRMLATSDEDNRFMPSIGDLLAEGNRLWEGNEQREGIPSPGRVASTLAEFPDATVQEIYEEARLSLEWKNRSRWRSQSLYFVARQGALDPHLNETEKAVVARYREIQRGWRDRSRKRMAADAKALDAGPVVKLLAEAQSVGDWK
jgi:hypothetical protein